jgi:NitT/TauT family transport system substrate-binding protein
VSEIADRSVTRHAARISRPAVMSFMAGGLAAFALPAAAQTGGVPVRMGSMAIDAAAQPNFGADAGIWAQNGILAQITVAQTGNTIMQAVMAGDLDVGVSNPLGLAVAVARNLPIAMIAPACLYSLRDGNPNLAVAKDGPIKAPRDLIGATFGVGALGDFSQLTLLAWLDKNNIPRDGVKFVELKRGEFGTALEKNLIQAALLTEPFKTDAMRAGQIRVIGDTELAVASETAPIVWFASKPWLQKNPDVARRLVKGIYATAQFANTHQAETAETLARITKLDPSVVANMKRLLCATSNERRYVEPTLLLGWKYGMLARPVTFDEFCPPIG